MTQATLKGSAAAGVRIRVSKKDRPGYAWLTEAKTRRRIAVRGDGVLSGYFKTAAELRSICKANGWKVVRDDFKK